MSPQLEFAPKPAEKSDLLAAAQLKYKAKDYQGALAEYNIAIELNPQDAIAYASRGVVHYRLGDVIEAMADYTQAIDLAPSLAVAYYRRAYIHYLVENYLSAIADYNKAIALDPNDAQAYANRAYAYRKLYGEAEGRDDFHRAAMLFKVQGNLEKYQKMLELVDEINNNHSWASGML